MEQMAANCHREIWVFWIDGLAGAWMMIDNPKTNATCSYSENHESVQAAIDFLRTEGASCEVTSWFYREVIVELERLISAPKNWKQGF